MRRVRDELDYRWTNIHNHNYLRHNRGGRVMGWLILVAIVLIAIWVLSPLIGAIVSVILWIVLAHNVGELMTAFLEYPLLQVFIISMVLLIWRDMVRGE